MPVSACKQSVASTLDNASLGKANPTTERSAAASSVQVSVGVNFNSLSAHSGPVFGGPPPRPVPENLRPNPGPPPRPTPTLPDPYYSKQSNELLAQTLLDRYSSFKAGWPSRDVTVQSLQRKASQPLTGNANKDSDIRLANELLRRPGLKEALDRNAGTGALDGRITKDSIRNFIRSDNPMKLTDDKQLAQEVLNSFNALKGGYFSNTIKLDELIKRGKKKPTGNSYVDYLTQLSKAVTARSDLTSSMDNRIPWLRDGKISRQDLYALLR